MAVEIIWSRQAKEDFKAILTHLKTNWSDDIADNFKETAYRKIELLESMPEMGIASALYPTVRRILLSNYNALYYQYAPNSSVVFLLSIFDTRANPTENPYN
ncbi:type II toxin-antitoxin system RelE/ParE family toxin [Spirosoma areae]